MTHEEIKNSVQAAEPLSLTVNHLGYCLRRQRSDKLLSLEDKEAVQKSFGRKKGAGRNELLSEIRELAERLGRSPRMADAKRGLVFRALTTFGSWNNALRKAGLDVNRITLPADKNEKDAFFKESIRKAAGILGRVPSEKEYGSLRKSKKAELPCESGIRAFYGSWENALKAAGFAPVEKFTKKDAEKIVQNYLSEGAKFIFFADLPGDPRQKRLVAKVAREKGLAVLKIKACRESLQKAAEMGFPELPGREKGRSYALLLVQGKTLDEIARAEGCSREWVRHLIGRYVDAAAHGERKRRREIDLNRIAEMSLEAFGSFPTIQQYSELRKLNPGLPCAGTLCLRFGRWPFKNKKRLLKTEGSFGILLGNKNSETPREITEPKRAEETKAT